MPWSRVARIDGHGIRRVRVKQRPEPNTVEPCPVHLADQDQPAYGGSLFFNLEEGRAGCGNPSCGWQGVPTRHAGVISTRCPACEAAPATDELYVTGRRRGGVAPARRSEKVARNALCPCGSGRKAKKCCYA